MQQQMTTDHERPWLVVLAAGLVSTAAALGVVYWLNSQTDTNVMGWYANYVIPAGALLVGMLAGSGYGVASWITGVKISRRLLWTVVGLQLCAYVGAQYLEFRALDLAYEDGTPVGFFTYFDLAARSFAWQQSGGRLGEPLGPWGYAFRLLEAVGFVCGGLVVPAVLRRHPYCDACQVYKRRRQLGLLPASAAARKLKKGDTQGQLEQQQREAEAQTRGQEMLATLERSAKEGRAAAISGLLDEHTSARKQVSRLPQRLDIALVTCPQCSEGALEATLIAGQGNNMTRHNVGLFDLAPAIVLELQQRTPSAKTS